MVALLTAPHGVPVPDSVTTHHATVAPAGELLCQLTGLEAGHHLLPCHTIVGKGTISPRVEHVTLHTTDMIKWAMQLHFKMKSTKVQTLGKLQMRGTAN